MKNKLFLVMMLTFIIMLLSGCKGINQPENQAYALVIGFDAIENNMIEITIQLPNFTGNSSQGEGSSGSNYLTASAKGIDYTEALKELKLELPLPLNLSHVKLVTISEELAKTEQLKDILISIVDTEQFYSSARFLICSDDAKNFVANLQPIFGKRISNSLTSLFENITELGTAPDISIANIYYSTHSIYSDVPAIYAIIEKEDQDGNLSSDGSDSNSSTGGDNSSGAENSSKTPTSEVSEGSGQKLKFSVALMKDGIMLESLSDDESVILNLLRGDVKKFNTTIDNTSVEFELREIPDFYVNVEGDFPRIDICIHLFVGERTNMPDFDVIHKKISDSIYDVIEKCQELNVEPFGFAESATKNFLTIDDWLEYDWHKKFASADIHLDLELEYTV